MLLVLDAAGPVCAAAVFDGAAQRGAASEAMARGHAERLFPLIEDAMARAGAARADLRAVAACEGPGGFAGVRVGVAAARGVALALAAPAVGVDWFAALGARSAGRTLVTFTAMGRLWGVRFRDGRALGPPAQDPAAQDGETVVDGPTAAAAAGPQALADLALARLAAGAPLRPRPMYLRPPDAAPPTPSAAARRV